MNANDAIRMRHMLDAARHRLVHAYFDIDQEVLWQTVRRDLPSLIVQLEPLLRDAE